MGVWLALIGGAAGWKAGKFKAYYYLVMAIVAGIPAPLLVWIYGSLAPLGTKSGTLADVLSALELEVVIFFWLSSFLYLAVPFTAMAWWKRNDLRKRQGE